MSGVVTLAVVIGVMTVTVAATVAGNLDLEQPQERRLVLLLERDNVEDAEVLGLDPRGDVVGRSSR